MIHGDSVDRSVVVKNYNRSCAFESLGTRHESANQNCLRSFFMARQSYGRLLSNSIREIPSFLDITTVLLYFNITVIIITAVRFFIILVVKFSSFIRMHVIFSKNFKLCNFVNRLEQLMDKRHINKLLILLLLSFLFLFVVLLI